MTEDINQNLQEGRLIFNNMTLYEWLKEKRELRKRNRDLRRDLKRLELAKEEADLQSKLNNGKRYYVLRDPNGKPVPANMYQIKQMIASGYMFKGVNIKNILEECLYFTNITPNTLYLKKKK